MKYEDSKTQQANGTEETMGKIDRWKMQNRIGDYYIKEN